MILQKTCHDMDILAWLIGKKCTEVHSFGSLSYFKKENAPEDSPEYCFEGCPVGDTCPYNAEKIYVDMKYGGEGWLDFVATEKVFPTKEDCMEAIKKGERLELTPEIIQFYKFKTRYLEEMDKLIKQCNDSILKNLHFINH